MERECSGTLTAKLQTTVKRRGQGLQLIEERVVAQRGQQDFFMLFFSFSFSNFFNLNLIFLFPFRGKVKRVEGRHGRTRK